MREQLERNDRVQLNEDEDEVTNRQGRERERGRDEKDNPECGLFLGLSFSPLHDADRVNALKYRPLHFQELSPGSN